MIWVICEDRNAGYKFWSVVADTLIKNSVTVIRGSGNSSLARNLKSLITSGQAKAGDTVYVAVDRLVVTHEYMLQNALDLQNELKKTRYLAESHKMNYFESDYICFEEVLLSFKYLLEFCSNSHSNASRDPYYDNLYKRVYKLIWDENTVDNLKLCFKDDISAPKEKRKTIEECLADTIRKVSMQGNFRRFKVTKNNIGSCWKYSCCDVKRDTYNANFCDSCNAVHNTLIPCPELLFNRLSFLANNSLLGKELNKLHYMK